MGWFRLHERVIEDPKVDKLPDWLFKQWIKVLCLASKNKGCLPKLLDDTAYALRVTRNKARLIIDSLVSARLLDAGDDQILRPHDWKDWQYQSDVSTERVQRFRKRERNVSEPLHETPPDTEQIRTETEHKTQAVLDVALLPDWIPPQIWEAYLEMRRKKRAYPTEHAKDLLIKKLGKLKAQGHSIQVVLEQSITSNWTDIFPPRQEQTNGTGRGVYGAGRTDGVARPYSERKSYAQESCPKCVGSGWDSSSGKAVRCECWRKSNETHARGASAAGQQ